MATRKARVTARARTRSGTGKTGKASPKSQFRGRRANITTDHKQIRAWVEARGGHPAAVKSSSGARGDAGVLRIDFPGFSGSESLKQITWAEWFKVFDQRRLGFLHQDRTASGKRSRFNKLVCR